MNTLRRLEDLLEGEVIVNGELCYSGVSPQIRVGGFSLWRIETTDNKNTHQVANYGPHFRLNLPTQPLIFGTSRESLLDGVHYTFSGPRLGEMDEFGGIAAKDGCIYTRFVNSIDMKAKLCSGALTLSLSGTAKSVPHIPGRPVGPNNLLNPVHFEIRCVIPTSAIPSVVEPAAGFNIQKRLECENHEEYIKATHHHDQK